MTSKFNVGDKVRVIKDHFKCGIGEIFVIKRIDGVGYLYTEDHFCVPPFKVELVKNKPSKNQRITTLEETVAKQGEEIEELKLIVAQIRKPSTEVSEALSAAPVEDNPFFAIPAPVKTANQLRAEIIEKAKVFVEKAKYKGIVNFTVGERSVIAVHQDTTCKPNRLKGAISNCHPNDVFNEHIGKAIALGRALGLDVSEFEQAVQPTEFLIGHVVTYTSDEAGKFKGFEEEIESFDGRNIEYTNGESYDIKGEDWGIKIINDTNAIYEGTVE